MAAGLHRRERASLTPPTGAVGGSWYEAEKSHLMHCMCGAGEQDEREQPEG